MNKIEALNALEIIDWSAGGGECEYVLAKNNEANFQVLLDAGFTENEIFEACDDGQTEIDLSYLAFNFGDADWWHPNSGFMKHETPIDVDL